MPPTVAFNCTFTVSLAESYTSLSTHFATSVRRRSNLHLGYVYCNSIGAEVAGVRL